MSEILGYDVTMACQDLTSFIAKAEAHYTALEQAIMPVDEKIADLQKDWEPRPLVFWSEIVRRFIPVIRQATTNCLSLFSRKQSQETPIPIILCATHIGYTCDLHCIEERIEEAGILLTASLCTPTSKSVEVQIRERQRLLKALQQLSKFVHESIDNARVKLASAPEEQRKLLSAKRRTPLHVVGENDE